MTMTPKLDLIVIDKPGSPEQVVNLTDPDTGEVVALQDAGRELITRVLGRTELAIQDHLDYLRSAKRTLGAELIKRMDANTEWTTHSRGVKVSAPSPTAGTVSWDAEMLDAILDQLVEEGVVNAEAKIKAVSQRAGLETHDDGIKRLLKVPAVADRIAPAKRISAAPNRSVTVKVTDPGEL